VTVDDSRISTSPCCEVMVNRCATAAALATLLVGGVAWGATFYVDCTGGEDSNDGRSEATAWRTIGRVSLATEIHPGDVVRLKRGCAWRESLIPTSGNATDGDVTYTSYGDAALAKPSLVGSASRNSVSDWVSTGPNLWTTGQKVVGTENALLNPSFDDRSMAYWYKWTTGDATVAFSIDTTDFDTAPASLLVNITTASKTSATNAQLWTTPFNITSVQYCPRSTNAISG